MIDKLDQVTFIRIEGGKPDKVTKSGPEIIGARL